MGNANMKPWFQPGDEGLSNTWICIRKFCFQLCNFNGGRRVIGISSYGRGGRQGGAWPVKSFSCFTRGRSYRGSRLKFADCRWSCWAGVVAGSIIGGWKDSPFLAAKPGGVPWQPAEAAVVQQMANCPGAGGLIEIVAELELNPRSAKPVHMACSACTREGRFVRLALAVRTGGRIRGGNGRLALSPSRTQSLRAKWSVVARAIAYLAGVDFVPGEHLIEKVLVP